jgi:predicted HicB family RNase H-like nuclease
MSDESRSEALFVKIRPSLRARIDADAAARGQLLTVWIERACETRLAQDELPLERRDGG